VVSAALPRARPYHICRVAFQDLDGHPHTHTPKHNSFRSRIASRKSFQFLSYLLLGGSGRFYGMMLTAFFKLTEAGIV
jgi:hypothetical protein